jgi:hypothetical protein
LSFSLALASLSLVAALLCAPAAAAVPDPLEPGRLGVNEVAYRAGEIALTVPQADGTQASFTQPLEGSVTFPTGPGPWPVVLFLHGRHTTCIDAGGTEEIPLPGSPAVQCPDVFGPGGQQLQTRIRSYAGYGYLSDILASRGYAVVSPDANVTASFDSLAPDGGIAARTQVIGATLDLMRRWSNGAGPGTIGTRLTGRLDLHHVALMGHSRGAEAVTQYIAFNRERSTAYPLNGVISVAPTDATGTNPFRNGGANLAELLPACDGDVFTLAGGHVFERVKYAPQGRRFTKLQWLVQGMNHNYFNTVWSGTDDALEISPTALDSACDPAGPDRVRLDPADQRKVGIALIISFIRRFEGGEASFGRIVTGAAFPPDLCPRRGSVPCDALVRTSTIRPNRRTVIAPGGSTPVRRNALGGRIRAHRLSLALCDPTQPDLPGPPLIPCPGLTTTFDDVLSDDGHWINRSWTPQLVATWRGPSALRTVIPRRSADVHRFRDLVLRSATTLSPRNPPGATQRYDVLLIDRHGDRARVPAERFSTALEPSLGDRMREVLLSDVTIPLRRFDGVDTRRLRAVELRFGVRGRRRGQVQLADLAFQGGGRAGAPRARTSAVRRRPGTAADAIPLGAVTHPDGVAGCGDAVAPALRVERPPTLARGRLSIRGSATDAGCSGLARVQVTVIEPARRGCRFLGPDGDLGPVTDCAHPYALVATGGARWSLNLSAAGLPRDTRVAVSALDRAGNLSRVRGFSPR